MDTGYTLEDNEQILQRINRHWISIVPVFMAAIVMALVAIFISYLLARYRDNLPATFPTPLIGLIMVILLIIAGLIVIVGLWVYRRNYVLLTNQHVIGVEQRGLFNRSVSQLSLNRVQDVSSATPGFFATIFGYGTLTIQTAGEEDNFVFPYMPRPSELANACLAAHDRYVDAATPVPPSQTPPTPPATSV